MQSLSLGYSGRVASNTSLLIIYQNFGHGKFYPKEDFVKCSSSTVPDILKLTSGPDKISRKMCICIVLQKCVFTECCGGEQHRLFLSVWGGPWLPYRTPVGIIFYLCLEVPGEALEQALIDHSHLIYGLSHGQGK